MFETAGLSVKFLKKEAYAGSHNGMRYTIKTNGEGITTYVYPEPWGLDATPAEDITQKDFPFSSDGVNEALEWLSSLYEEKREFWEKADKDKMAKLLQKK